MSKTKTLTCPGPPEHTFEFEQKKRGRPPRFCAEHKPQKTQRQQDLERGAAIMAGTEEGERLQAMADAEEETNPFIKKAKSNPFIDKAKRLEKLAEDLEAGTGTAAEDEATLAKAEKEIDAENTKPAPRPSSHRPARFEQRVFETISDDQSYNDAALPGVKIHSIERNSGGQWSCRLTVNEETFDLIRRGGWLIIKPDGTGFKEALPHVAAAIQARVRRLEDAHKHVEGDSKDGDKRQKPQKTLEQVADEVAPETHASPMPPVVHDDEIENMPEDEFEGVECECCSRVQKQSETGWAIIDEIQFCPTCVAELDSDGEIDDDNSEDDLDSAAGAMSDFAETIEAELS